MQRELFVGRQRFVFTQVDNARAFRDWTGEPHPAGTLDGLPSLSKRGREAVSSLRRDGWIFSGDPLDVAEGTQFGPGRMVLVSPDGLPAIANGQLVVRFVDDTDPALVRTLSTSLGFQVQRTLSFTKEQRIFLVSSAGATDALDLSQALLGNPKVLYAEPELLVDVHDRMTVTDPGLSDQWQHDRTGAAAAWTRTLGERARLAVIDRGFHSHPDLEFDPDAAGCFTDTPSGLSFTQGLKGLPEYSHGTQCAGMAAARNNKRDGRGSAPGCTLVPIALDGSISQVAVARVIAYAIQPAREIAHSAPDGADIIVCSLGFDDLTMPIASVLSDALDFAYSEGRSTLGTPIFWATDWDKVSISLDPICSHPRVIAVGMSNIHDEGGFTAFGPELEFLAPGVGIYTTSGKKDFLNITGTSYAAPYAAGIAALALSVNEHMTIDRLRDLLRESCKKIGATDYIDGRNDRYGYGLIQADAVVDGASRIQPPVPTQP